MPKFLILFFVLSNYRECLGNISLKGERTRDGHFPWLIQFQAVVPCGGVLLSPDWVLTAAQCVRDKRSSILLYATGLNGTGTNQTARIKATYVYPKYQAYSTIRDYDYNVALLKLDEAFDMCDSKVRLLDIAPVRLDDDYKSCFIFGWQGTVNPTTGKVLAKPMQYSKVLLNSWRLCNYMPAGNADNRRNATRRNIFCTMIDDKDGIRACAGNPGSPVVCEDQYQRMVLLGIASWSNFSLDCGSLPAYLGLSVFRSWMYDLIFGNKNMEQWENGAEPKAGACHRDRYLGGIYAESNLQARIHNYTERPGHSDIRTVSPEYDDYQERRSREDQDDDFAVSWKDSVKKNSVAKNTPTNNARMPGLRGKLEPPLYEDVDDYARVLAPGDPRKSSNYDVVRRREEELSQYREIGRSNYDRRQDRIDDSARSHRVPGKSANGFSERETADQDLAGSFDDLELVMPDGIDDFSRSAVATFLPYSIYKNTFLALLVHTSVAIQ